MDTIMELLAPILLNNTLAEHVMGVVEERRDEIDGLYYPLRYAPGVLREMEIRFFNGDVLVLALVRAAAGVECVKLPRAEFEARFPIQAN